MSLGAKTTALLVAITAAVLVTTSGFALHFHSESLKRAIFDSVDAEARLAARGIGAFVDNGLKEARAIAVTFPTAALSRGDLDEVGAHLRKMLETFPKFQNGIFVLDPDGNFIADYPAHPELRGTSFAFRDYYQRTVLTGTGIVGEPYRSKRTDRPVLTFTAPVQDDMGRVVAILACSVDLVSPRALGGYGVQKHGETGYLYAFDPNRLLVVHPDPARLLTHVEAGKNRLLEAALGGFEGAGETVNSLGVPMLLAVRKIPDTDWIVGVQVTQKEAYAPIVSARKRILTLSAIALLLLVPVGAFMVRRISRPLQQLERVASQINAELERPRRQSTLLARNALDSLQSIRSSDEIGHLASSFLRLAVKLERTLGSLRRSAQDWERTFNSVHEAVVTLDEEGRILRMNLAAENWFRTSTESFRSREAHRLFFGDGPPPAEWPAVASLVEGHALKWSQRLEKPAGVFDLTLAPISSNGGITGAVLVINDVTERVEREMHARSMAFYDHLTRLPNRAILHDRLDQAIAFARREGKKAGVMFVDLDRFKEVNDRYGHDVGDEALRLTASRIGECIRKNDTLARFGGDEFVIVLQGVEWADEAAAIAQRIVAAQEPAFVVRGREFTVGASIGIALFPDDGEDGETLLTKADRAMYQAKGLGRSSFKFHGEGPRADPGVRAPEAVVAGEHDEVAAQTRRG